jgi:hypothetical protein
MLAGGLTILGIIASVWLPTVAEYLRGKPIYHARDMVNVDSDVDIDSQWTLGGFSQISGTNYLIAPVYSKQEYSVGFSSGKEASATRNYLVLNSVDKSTHWVAALGSYLFLNESEIHENGSNNTKVLALRFDVVQEDTNQDGRITMDDERTFAVSDIDGSNFTPVVTGIDEFLGDRQPSADTILLFYRSGGKNFLADIKISEKKVIDTRELPRVNG